MHQVREAGSGPQPGIARLTRSRVTGGHRLSHLSQGVDPRTGGQAGQGKAGLTMCPDGTAAGAPHVRDEHPGFGGRDETGQLPGFTVTGGRHGWRAGGDLTRWRWVTGSGRHTWKAVPVTASISQSVLSTQYVQVPVTVLSPPGYDPTSDVVEFAFTPQTYPATSPSEWISGSWAAGTVPPWWAQCLVGPGEGGTPLTAGTWQVWVRVTDSPEQPVFQPLTLIIE